MYTPDHELRGTIAFCAAVEQYCASSSVARALRDADTVAICIAMRLAHDAVRLSQKCKLVLQISQDHTSVEHDLCEEYEQACSSKNVDYRVSSHEFGIGKPADTAVQLGLTCLWCKAIGRHIAENSAILRRILGITPATQSLLLLMRKQAGTVLRHASIVDLLYILDAEQRSASTYPQRKAKAFVKAAGKFDASCARLPAEAAMRLWFCKTDLRREYLIQESQRETYRRAAGRYARDIDCSQAEDIATLMADHRSTAEHHRQRLEKTSLWYDVGL